ncbi:MAG: GW dipeptide domain-containing protein, partial [Bacteroidales bacterium]|nr:GW dipeptide domain-containing protein [Bacteroidales bacterium]
MRFLLIIALAVTFLSSCNQQTNNTADNTNKLDEVMDQLSSVNDREAKVLEATDAGTYTYVKLDDKGKIFWAAITARQVEIGKTYAYEEGMMMKNFESKQLGKVWDSVMFIQNFSDAKAVHAASIAKSEPHQHTKTAPLGGINVEPAANGKTIAGIYDNSKALSGSKVIVRGQVVKISESIMRKNWIHIQDGTESNGNYDL